MAGRWWNEEDEGTAWAFKGKAADGVAWAQRSERRGSDGGELVVMQQLLSVWLCEGQWFGGSNLTKLLNCCGGGREAQAE
ncbi:hypothetical protein M0R45_024775 [Rubus argutus]|uniref:Uncharacterized protein n=1 Tax=Rubus argutus TaxID=59490 RepID=A0AAW1WVB6_RUBAR